MQWLNNTPLYYRKSYGSVLIYTVSSAGVLLSLNEALAKNCSSVWNFGRIGSCWSRIWL